MVGQVPQSRPPAYAQDYAQTQASHGANRASMLDSQLSANAASLGHILGNIKGIAEVGGGAIAPDRLLTRFAGTDDLPIFNNEYAQAADGLRLADMAAEVGKKNRANRPSTRGGMQMDPGTIFATIKDADGNVIGTQPVKSTDELATLQRLAAGQGLEVAWQPTPSVQDGDVTTATKGKNSAEVPVVTGGNVVTANEPAPSVTQKQGNVAGEGAEGPAQSIKYDSAGNPTEIYDPVSQEWLPL